MADAVLFIANSVNKIGEQRQNHRLLAYSFSQIGEVYCNQFDLNKPENLEIALDNLTKAY